MNNKQLKILITGGAGYIGSVLTPYLLSEKFQVTVIDNFKFQENSLALCCNNKNFSIINDDVRNEKLLKKLVKEHDIIIPLAAIVGAPLCEIDKNLAYEINVLQIQHIIESASNINKIIIPVTNSGYGIGKEGVYCDENSPLNPISHYGKTKVEAENLLKIYGNFVSLRLATVFGCSPRMRVDLLVNDFVHRAYKDKFIVLFESHFKRNYIHIKDICRAILHSINNYDKMKGESFNVGLSNANLSKKELCVKIKTHIKDFHIYESDIAKDPDQRNYIVSNEKIEKTNWAPLYDLDFGIQELIKMYSYLQTSNYKNY